MAQSISRYPQPDLRPMKGIQTKIVERGDAYFLHIHNDSHEGVSSLSVQVGERNRTDLGGVKIITFKPSTIKLEDIKAGEIRPLRIKLSNYSKHPGNNFTGLHIIKFKGETESGRKFKETLKYLRPFGSESKNLLVEPASFPSTLGGLGTQVANMFKGIHAFAHALRLRGTRPGLVRAARNQINGHNKH